MKPDSRKSLLRKNLKDQPAFRPSQYWLARITPRVLQWDVLCGIPYRGRGAFASPYPTNRLLFSLSGRLSSHFRSSTALKQLSESITAYSHLQACVRILSRPLLKSACCRCVLVLSTTRFRLPQYRSAFGCNFLRLSLLRLSCKPSFNHCQITLY
jgi:hypothetical protein